MSVLPTLSGWLRRAHAGALASAALLALVAVGQERDLERARERWRDLPEERRRELVERYEHWKQLPEQERARLRERFQHVDPLRRSAHECLPEKARRDFAKLAPEQQAEVLAGVASQQIRERGRDMLERLPRDWRERYERATPQERAELVEQFKVKMTALARERVEQLGRDGLLARAEVERLRAASPEELARVLIDLEARRFRERVDREGLPSYVSAEQWKQWKELPHGDLWRRFHEARRDCEPRERGEGRPEDRSDGRRGAPQPENVRRLSEALRPDPAWFVELAGATPEHKLEQLGERLRERALDQLAAEPGLVDAERLTELRALHGREFFEALHRAVPELEPPSWTRGRSSRGDSKPDPRRSRGAAEGAPKPGTAPGTKPRGGP